MGRTPLRTAHLIAPGALSPRRWVRKDRVMDVRGHFEQDRGGEDSLERVSWKRQELEGAHRRGQREPLDDQKQAYYKAKGIPNPEIQNQIANTRKRYSMSLAETEPQAEPHSPNRASLSSDSQTEDGEIDSSRKRSKKKHIHSVLQLGIIAFSS